MQIDILEVAVTDVLSHKFNNDPVNQSEKLHSVLQG